MKIAQKVGSPNRAFLVIVVLAFSLLRVDPGIDGLLQRSWLDFCLRVLSVVSPPTPSESSGLVHVDFGGKSAADLHEPRLTRATAARLILALARARVQTIVFNIILEKQANEDIEGTRALADAMTEFKHVWLAIGIAPSNGRKPGVASLPEPSLALLAEGLGHIDFQIDIDGTVRSFQPLVSSTRGVIPAMGLAMFQKLWRSPAQADYVTPSPDARLLFYRGPSTVHAHLEVSKILQDSAQAPAELAGATVIVSDEGLDGSPRARTPFETRTSLSAALAAELDTVRSGKFIHEVSLWANLVIDILLGCIAAIVMGGLGRASARAIAASLLIAGRFSLALSLGVAGILADPWLSMISIAAIAIIAQIRAVRGSLARLRQRAIRDGVLAEFGQRAAGWAHSLKGLSSLAKYYGQLLAKGSDGNSRYAELLTNSLREIDNSVANVLSALRAEVTSGRTDPVAVAQGFAALYGSGYKAPRVIVEIGADVEGLAIQGALLARAIEVPLSNAVKASTRSDGVDSGRVVTVRLERSKEALIISIEDCAGGIERCRNCSRSSEEACLFCDWLADQNESDGGWGLYGLRGELDRAGGTLLIISTSQGSTIRSKIPVGRLDAG